jgi:hypothetical protein
MMMHGRSTNSSNKSRKVRRRRALRTYSPKVRIQTAKQLYDAVRQQILRTRPPGRSFRVRLTERQLHALAAELKIDHGGELHFTDAEFRELIEATLEAIVAAAIAKRSKR